MRKVLTCLALVSLLYGISNVWAQNSTAVIEYEYSIENATGEPISFVVPTTSIRPYIDKITAYEAVPNTMAAETETFIGIFDDTTVEMSGEKIGEKEAGTGASCGERFARPKKILNGIVVQLGSYTTGIIYFVRE